MSKSRVVFTAGAVFLSGAFAVTSLHMLSEILNAKTSLKFLNPVI
jgi:hypothetical protein